MNVDVIGVYPVENASEPCHLVELSVTGHGVFDVSEITQPDAGVPEADWQAPYDEYLLAADGNSGGQLDFSPIQIHGQARLTFFFHLLASSEPLRTPCGSVSLPAPMARPERLQFIVYEPPC